MRLARRDLAGGGACFKPPLEEGQGKGGGLAGAGVGGGPDITTSQDGRDGRHLNRGRCQVVSFGHGPNEMGEYTIDFLDMHDLALDFLVGKSSADVTRESH